jgi:uncharacterized protein YgbK (DUF1537 family)
MRMLQIIIIADDLTGAADTGVVFAQAGLTTLIALHGTFGETPRRGVSTAARRTPKFPDCDVLALSTESRQVSREEAAERVRRACRGLSADELVCVYKKMDSTLRGHPAAELAAIMEVLKIERAAVAPAFPAQGRTTVGGRQLAGGTPVERTAFGRDVPDSDLVELFRKAAGGRQVRRVGRESVLSEAFLPGRDDSGIVVADAETDADLLTIAQAAVQSGVRLFCGSAGLARALVKVLALRPVSPTPTPLPSPRGPVLVVAGSRHPSTAREVEFARRKGAAVVRPGPAFFGGDMGVEIREASEHLRAGRDVVLTTVGSDDSPLGGPAVAERLAQMVRRLVVGDGGRSSCKQPVPDVMVGGLVLTGGDIAAAVCAALEVSAIWLRSEVQPGVPFGILIDGARSGLCVVTKAGGFGGDDTLFAAIGYLNTGR